MDFRTLNETLEMTRQAGVTLFIWGSRGLGKSSAVAQYCKANKRGLIDFRCSQIEAADLRGLPDKVNGRTAFLPPQDMPVGGMSWDEFMAEYNAKPEDEKEAYWNKMQPQLNEGILFLDEVNRGQDDVLQAVFQLILDRKIGAYTMPKGWSVVCAGNFMVGEYMVNGFTDPAFLNRFCHVVLSEGDTTLDEWVSYMASTHGQDASSVIEFATQNVKHLDGAVGGELGFSITPSRRSWDAVARVEKIYREAKFSDNARHQVIAGLVGQELATAYVRYSCPVKPKEIIDRGVKAMEGKLSQLKRLEMIGLTWGLVSFVKPHIEEDKYGEVAMDFALWCCKNSGDKDLVVAFCRALVDCKPEEMFRLSAISNPKCLSFVIKKGQKGFLERLADPKYKELQSVLSKTAWGGGGDDDKPPKK